MKKLIALTYITASLMFAASPAVAQNVLENIKANIASDPALNGYRLRFSVVGSDVTVTGTVPTESARTDVEQAIRNTPGVTVVRNFIKTDPSLPTEAAVRPVSDQELQSALADALARDGFPVGRNLTLAVDQGVVSYTGQRSSFEEIDKILAITLNVQGVREIKNEMTIGSRSYSSLKFRHQDGQVTQTTDKQ